MANIALHTYGGVWDLPRCFTRPFPGKKSSPLTDEDPSTHQEDGGGDSNEKKDSLGLERGINISRVSNTQGLYEGVLLYD